MLSHLSIQQFADAVNQRCRFRPSFVGKHFLQLVEFPSIAHRQPQTRFFYCDSIYGFPHRFRKFLEWHVEQRRIPSDIFEPAFRRQILPPAETSVGFCQVP